MTKQIEAMKLALDALEKKAGVGGSGHDALNAKAIAAMREVSAETIYLPYTVESKRMEYLLNMYHIQIAKMLGITIDNYTNDDSIKLKIKAKIDELSSGHG